MPQLSAEKFYESAAKIAELTQFPNCVGALDVKCLFHRKYHKPHMSKGRHYKVSAVLFAIVDASYCFLAIHLLPKSQPDIQAFMSTLLGKIFYLSLE